MGEWYMAREISISGSLSASKNGVQVSQSVSAVVDMTGDKMLSNVQAVGTALEAINKGDIGTLGYVLFKNLDATNYVDICSANDIGTSFAKLLPLDFTIIKASAAATYYAKANTAGINLLVEAIEL
jgi:hypothetical protein